MKIKCKNIEKQKFKVMKKTLLFVWLVFNTILAMMMSAMSVDWLLGGGCTRIMNRQYEPAFLSQIWEVTSHIYTWAPEGTIFRGFLFLAAFLVTFGIPIAIAVYLYNVCKILFGKYREA